MLTPLDPVPEPRNLRKLKASVRRRWGVVPLLGMFTETALRTSCLDALIPAGTRLGMEPAEFFERMLLVIYAYGIGAGIRSVASGEHSYSEEDLRYSRRRFLSVAGAREVAKAIANATFTARQTTLWGEGTTAVASDSTHFSSFDQNIFTEYHSRYKRAKRGVNDYIRFGKRGELASNKREEQELGMLCLQILQSSLGYINTLMLQDPLAERGVRPRRPAWPHPAVHHQHDPVRHRAAANRPPLRPQRPADTLRRRPGGPGQVAGLSGSGCIEATAVRRRRSGWLIPVSASC